MFPKPSWKIDPQHVLETIERLIQVICFHLSFGKPRTIDSLFGKMWGQLRSRGSTGRSSSNPMGWNTGLTWRHNVMVSRVIILLVIAMAKKIWWCLEQPKGSLLAEHTLFQKMLRLRNVHVFRSTTNLGHFGADSLKPIWIYSSNSDSHKSTVLFQSTSIGECVGRFWVVKYTSVSC